MTKTTGPVPAKYASRPLQWILPIITSDWLDIALKAWKVVRQHLGREVQQGMYEILDYSSMLELKDRRGKVAVLERRQKVRFVQDNIIAFQDQAWGDGDLFADYKCKPGKAVDRYRDGFKWKVLISLRETKNRGDVTEFRLTRKITNGFTQPNEWLQTELSHRTHRLSVGITFPQGRPCQRAMLVERNRNRTTPVEPSCLRFLPDGRQVLTWETDRPRINELYTIKWQW